MAGFPIEAMGCCLRAKERPTDRLNFLIQLNFSCWGEGKIKTFSGNKIFSKLPWQKPHGILKLIKSLWKGKKKKKNKKELLKDVWPKEGYRPAGKGFPRENCREREQKKKAETHGRIWTCSDPVKPWQTWWWAGPPKCGKQGLGWAGAID